MGTGMHCTQPCSAVSFPPRLFYSWLQNHKANLKESTAGFYECPSPLSVPCSRFCQRAATLQTRSTDIFSCYSEMTVRTGIIYLPAYECMGLWWGGCLPNDTFSSREVGTVAACRSPGARQAAGRAHSKSVGRKRRTTAMEYHAYGVQRICSTQIFLLRPQVSKW